MGEVDEMELGLDETLAVWMDDHVVVVFINPTDAPGTFRVQRGLTSLEAIRTQAVATQVNIGLDAEEWGALGDTGLEVKINQWPPLPLLIGVRRVVTS